MGRNEYSSERGRGHLPEASPEERQNDGSIGKHLHISIQDDVKGADYPNPTQPNPTWHKLWNACPSLRDTEIQRLLWRQGPRAPFSSLYARKN